MHFQCTLIVVFAFSFDLCAIEWSLSLHDHYNQSIAFPCCTHATFSNTVQLVGICLFFSLSPSFVVWYFKIVILSMYNTVCVYVFVCLISFHSISFLCVCSKSALINCHGDKMSNPCVVINARFSNKHIAKQQKKRATSTTTKNETIKLTKPKVKSWE